MNIRRYTSGLLHGDMLDGEGFASSLLKRKIKVKGKKVYLAGTGGAGCTIAYAMAARQVKELIIYNRIRNKSTELINKLLSRYPDVNIYAGSSVPEQVDIAINATSDGMGENKGVPFSLDKLGSKTTVCDIVIFPQKTPLLSLAEQHKLPIHKGRAMLTAQIELMLNFMLHQDS